MSDFLHSRGTASRVGIAVACVLVGAYLVSLVAPALGPFTLVVSPLVGAPLGLLGALYIAGLIFERR